MKLYEYLKKFKHIHIVGIGGISTSAIAKICLNNGVKVSGSDNQSSNITEELKHLGVKIFNKHSENNVKGANLVVYTSAVKENNVELLYARKNGILTMERTEFLHNLCSYYKNVIAVSGTHGKTTTTAMIGNIFIEAGLNPTIHIGGECDNFNGNLKLGGTNFFILEACEYQKHLVKIPHNLGVILNIELDHVECYKGYDDLFKTFSEFAEKSEDAVIINEKHFSIVKNKDKTISFAENMCGDFYAKNIKFLKDGTMSFNCFKKNKMFGYFRINCYGKHNVYNALAAICVADYYKISYDDIYKGLSNFKGVKRRFEYVGLINNQITIHDYAHHPTAIETAIKTAKQAFKKQVLVVFQPHTYSRTKFLFSQFISKLNYADNILILPTYPAREKPKDGYSAKKLYNKLKLINNKTKYFTSFNFAFKYLRKQKNNVVLILGAGDIYKLAKRIKNEYISKK